MPGEHRKHTPIVSEAQRGMMGSELGRRREGKKSRMPSMITGELESHLHESAGKNLPSRVSKSKGKHNGHDRSHRKGKR